MAYSFGHGPSWNPHRNYAIGWVVGLGFRVYSRAKLVVSLNRGNPSNYSMFLTMGTPKMVLPILGNPRIVLVYC